MRGEREAYNSYFSQKKKKNKRLEQKRMKNFPHFFSFCLKALLIEFNHKRKNINTYNKIKKN